MRFNNLFLLLIIFCSQLSYSQTCCSGGVPLSNNIGLPFLEKGATQLGFFYDYNNLNTLNEGTRKLDDTSRKRTTHSFLFNFSHNFSDRFLVEGLFSWVNQQRKISQFGNVNFEETKGIGDGVLLFRYMLLNKKSRNLSIGVGGKIPLGSTQEVNQQGLLLNADLQPGSNNFDYIFTSTYTTTVNFRKSMNFIIRSTFRGTGVNNKYLNVSTYEFGNVYQGFLGVSDRLLIGKKLIDISLLFKYRNAKADEINRNIVANTGGEWVFFNPTFSFKLSQKISFSTRMDIPIYSNVTGLQLTPTLRINSGISVQFFKKPDLKLFKI